MLPYPWSVRVFLTTCFGLLAASQSAAQIAPTFSQTVAANGNRNSPGAATNDGFGAIEGSVALAEGEFAVREAGPNNPRDENSAARLVTFHQFDVSSLPLSVVNDPGFRSAFAIDYLGELFIANVAVAVDAVAEEDTWDASGDDGTVPLFEWAADSLGTPQTLITAFEQDSFPIGGAASVPVTSIVQNWANGTVVNNGFVVSINSSNNNSIKYGNPRIVPGMTEPVPLSESAQVSLNGDADGAGIQQAGITGTDFVIRDRASNEAGMEDGEKQIATFHRFDLSGLTLEQVNSPVFSAAFSIDFVQSLNTTIDAFLEIGAVSSVNAWDDSGAPGTFPLFEWEADSPLGFLSLDVTANTPGVIDIDVTETVRSWVADPSTNNGFVLSLNERNQGVGYNSPQLSVVVPLTLDNFDGDFNGDLVVDAADYTVWRDNLGGDDSLINGNGDAGNPLIDAADYQVWRANFGNDYSAGQAVGGFEVAATPEPGAAALAWICVAAAGLLRRR